MRPFSGCLIAYLACCTFQAKLAQLANQQGASLGDRSDVLQSEAIALLNDFSEMRTASLDMPGIVSGTLDETRDFMAFLVALRQIEAIA